MRAWRLASIGGVTSFCSAALGTTVMVLLVKLGATSVLTALAGAALLVPTILLGRVIGRGIDFRGARDMLLIGSTLQVALFLSAALLPVSRVSLVVVALGFGVAQPAIDNSVNTIVSHASSERQLVRVNGAVSVAQNVCRLGGPVAAASLISLGREQIIWYILMVFAAGTTLLTLPAADGTGAKKSRIPDDDSRRSGSRRP